MSRFELSRLDRYDDESLISELQRVASLVDAPIFTQAAFQRYSKASVSVIRRRFGGWMQALTRAGLTERFSGTPQPRRTLLHGRRAFTDDELLGELRSVAQKLGSKTVTVEQFNRHGVMNGETIRRRFGSWWIALERAGLDISNLGKRYSEEDYFENLLKVWTHRGRQPTYGEMERPPSWIRAGAYEAKWGTWRSALKAFLYRVTTDVAESPDPSTASKPSCPASHRGPIDRARAPAVDNSRRESIPLGLRYDVLRRDRFRCVICGDSPAARLGCELHIDHITPLKGGGKTVPENLRILCSKCNLGKGSKTEHEISSA